MPVRILVVDDFAPARRFISSALSRKADYQIVGEASDGLSAVQKAEELQPDLIVLDLGLPKLNGIEAASRISKLCPQTKLLFVSQHSSSGVVRETLRSGGSGYVHKMRVHSDLAPAIEAILADRRFVSGGVETSGGRDGYSHVAQFCSDDTVFMESLTWFIGSALKDGGAGISLVAESRKERLAQQLRAAGLDIDGAVRQGTYIPLGDGFRGLVESAARATKKEPPHVAFGGEFAGFLCEEGHTNWGIQVEKAANELRKTHNVDILCLYGHTLCKTGDHVFGNICEEHAVIYSR